MRRAEADAEYEEEERLNQLVKGNEKTSGGGGDKEKNQSFLFWSSI